MPPSSSTGSADSKVAEPFTSARPPENIIEAHIVHDIEPYGTYGESWYCAACGKELGYNTLHPGGEPSDGCCRFCGSDDIAWCEWGDVPGFSR